MNKFISNNIFTIENVDTPGSGGIMPDDVLCFECVVFKNKGIEL